MQERMEPSFNDATTPFAARGMRASEDLPESGAGLPEAGSTAIEFFTHHKVCYVKYR